MHKLRLFCFLLSIATALVLACAGQWAGAAKAVKDFPVLYAQLEGPISPASVDFLESATETAGKDGARVLLLRLDTPGGLVDSMRSMVKMLVNAPVPVLIWVGPGGAHAASAGVFLVAASAVAAMSPGATIGAASPVSAEGKEIPETMQKKVKNDLKSLVRGLAQQHGRNPAWYEKAVEESVSITAEEAVMQKVVEFVAVGPEDFLDQAGRRGVSFRGQDLRFTSADTRLISYDPGLRFRFLAWLLHPQIAYMLLLGGMAGLFFELTNTGAVFPGVLGGICLLLGLYAMSVLPTNAAGVLLLLLGVVFFVLEIKITSYGMLTVAALVSLFFGSLILFKPGEGFDRLPLSLIISTVSTLGVLLGLAVFLVARTMRNPPASGGEAMLGLRAEVREWARDRGMVLVRGELWKARTESPQELREGEEVEVVAREGLTLTITPGRKH